MPRRTHDVAIYAPFASEYYSKVRGRAGGAELQTTILAHELAQRGLSVAHILYPVPDPRPLEPPAPDVVERPTHQRRRPLEAGAIWLGFRRARARVYLVRGGGGHLTAATAFCQVRRRRLVFAASNDLDFDFGREDRNRYVLRAYSRVIRLADRVVVQTGRQRELARAALPGLDPILIPSFAQPARNGAGSAKYFLWADRLVEYKRPDAYLDLAEALPEAHFLMVGTRTSELTPDLERRVMERAERIPNLELVGGRPREQLLEEIRHATAVVSTSLVEGMPNTFLEAWARGVPVLSLHVDPDDRIGERAIGIVAGGSMERFVEGAASLWGNGRARSEMGERAQRFVREIHSPGAVADRWAALLRDLLR